MNFLKIGGMLLASAILFANCGGAPEKSMKPSSGHAADPSDHGANSPETDLPDILSFDALPEPFRQADYAAARNLFRQHCSGCHILNADGGNLVGPNLYGLFGRTVGTLPGFGYSSALITEDFQWSPALLDQWLQSPRQFLPGNRMTFSGLRREQDRQAIIAYVMARTGYSTE